MKIDELIKILSERLGQNINQSMLAHSLGITRQTISNRIKNNSEVTVSELKKIEKYFSISILDKISISFSNILVDYYPNVFVSCGDGAIVFSEEKETIPISKNLILNFSSSKTYSMIHARGDSMAPYILDNDKLITEHCFDEQIIDNKIYVFCYKGEFFVKRLSKNVDEVIITSDNPNYSPRIIKNQDLYDLRIIGIIKGIIRAT